MLKRVRRQQCGQSLVEFAFTIFAFLLVLFSALSTALYAVQRSAAVTAAAAGVRAAASARSDSPNSPDLAAAGPLVSSRMQAVLFGTTFDPPLPPGRPCDSLDAIRPGHLEVCTTLDPQDPTMVLVIVRGRPENLLPLIPLPWAIDAAAEIHQVTFTR
jgi:hypothetical protein